MSAGLWQRMRDGLIAAGEPITARELAERIGDGDELVAVRNILYINRKRGHHVERLAPAQPGGQVRWRLLRDARVQHIYRRRQS
ncbi:MAG: hypothetical protein WA961_14560 [Rhodanobacter sp.]